MKKYTFILLPLLFSIHTSAIAQQKLSPTDAQIDGLFGDWTDETKPGLALCVLNNGRKEFQRNWGLANLEHKIPIENETVFLFPDMSEQMLAFGILLLADREELSLDEHLSTYLDFLPDHLQTLTIEDLLHHRAGLIPMHFVKALAGYDLHAETSQADLHSLLNKKESTGGSINTYDYSRAGLRLLQLILEKKTDNSFASFVQKEIFTPLRMNHSYIATPDQSISEKAQGYIVNQDEITIHHEYMDYLKCDQLYTTASDLCLWADNFWRPKIGNSDIISSMDEFITSEGKPLEMQNTAQYLGQHRYWNYQGESKLYQIGQTQSFSAKLIRYPEHDLAIVVLGNFGTYNGHLATACSEFYLEPFLTATADEKVQPDYLATNHLDLEKYCGSYWDYHNESGAFVTQENDSLFYTHALYGWKVKLERVADDQFYLNRRSGYDVAINADKGELIFSVPGRKPTLLTKVPVDNLGQISVTEIQGHYYSKALASSFEIVENDEGLTLRNIRQTDIRFSPLTKDTYTSTDLYYSRINVDRDMEGIVRGIRISNPKLKDIYFQRQSVQ